MMMIITIIIITFLKIGLMIIIYNHIGKDIAKILSTTINTLDFIIQNKCNLDI